MSKGPITASINQIDAAKGFHVLHVKSLQDEKSYEFELPDSVDVSNLDVSKVITVYFAEENGQENGLYDEPLRQRPVLVFARNRLGYGFPKKEERFFWFEKGTPLFELQKLPRIVEILLSLSPYYGKRRDVVEKSLEVLKLTQEPETLDALFSMQPHILYALLGNKVHPLPVEQAKAVSAERRKVLVHDAFLSVQIADALVALFLAGADLEHPRRRDICQILALAIIHGMPYKEACAFIASYERA